MDPRGLEGTLFRIFVPIVVAERGPEVESRGLEGTLFRMLVPIVVAQRGPEPHLAYIII